MKRNIILLALASTLVTGMVSCKKEETVKAAITETINANLKVNETYTFTLPKNLRDDPYEITTQAKHFSISEVGMNTAGERIFTYTPETGYVGSDQVIVSNDQEREEHHMHPQGPPPNGPHGMNCMGGEEDHYIITINLVVDENSTTSTTRK